jgi:hypothetical protein
MKRRSFTNSDTCEGIEDLSRRYFASHEPPRLDMLQITPTIEITPLHAVQIEIQYGFVIK